MKARVRAWLDETHGAQFELVRHFLGSFFDSEMVSTPGEWTKVAVGAFAALVSVGVLILPLYWQRYNHLLSDASSAVEYRQGIRDDIEMFAAVAMWITALLTAIQWQSLFPSLRDSLALAGLPVKPVQIFRAKFTALLLMFGALALTLAGPTALLLAAASAGRWRENPSAAVNVAAAFLAIAGGCAFVFFGLMALQGLLLNVLPARWFGSVSTAVQGLVCIVTLGILPFLGRQLAGPAYWPPNWFLGMWTAIIGADDADGRKALLAMGLAAAIAVLSYLASYHRYRRVVLTEWGSKKIPGPATLPAWTFRSVLCPPGRAWIGMKTRAAQDVGPTPPDTLRPLSKFCRQANRPTGASAADQGVRPTIGVFKGVSATVLEWWIPDPREQAAFAFIWKSLARSRNHRLVLWAYGGIALGCMMNGLSGSTEGLHASAGSLRYAAVLGPLTGAIFVVAALRYLFSLPLELRANWVFRMTEKAGRASWLRAVARFVVCCGIVPVFAFTLPLAAAVLGLAPALKASALGFTLAMGVFEAIFRGWRKLPFACSYLPGKRSLMATLRPYLLALAGLAAVGRLFLYCLDESTAFLAVEIFLAAAWWRLRKKRVDEWSDRDLCYEEARDPDVMSLGLEADRDSTLEHSVAIPAPAHDLFSGSFVASRRAFTWFEDTGEGSGARFWLETLFEDIRYGFRLIRRSTALSTVLVLTLTMGIGMNVGMFSLINAVVFRARVDHPESFVTVIPKYLGAENAWFGEVSHSEYLVSRTDADAEQPGGSSAASGDDRGGRSRVLGGPGVVQFLSGIRPGAGQNGPPVSPLRVRRARWGAGGRDRGGVMARAIRFRSEYCGHNDPRQ